MNSDTKILIVLLNDLEFWKKSNVTAFLTSGIVGKFPDLIGAEYKDKSVK